MIDLSALDVRFARLAEEYDRRRAAAYAAVVRWEWYDDDAFDLRPLHYERDLRRPGRRLSERPPVSRHHARIGFDDEDRLVVLLEYSGFLDGRLYYETFRMHFADVVEQVHFSADGGPIYLHEYHFETGLIRAAVITAIAGGGYETYEYDGDQVTRVAVHHVARVRGGRLGRPEPWTVIDAVHDGEGLSRLETSAPGGPSQVKYERPPAGFTVESAWQTIQGELLRQIPLSVGALAIDVPAYCVALVYTSPADPADLMVHVGLDEDRRARPAEDSHPDDVWSPADMAYETPVDVRAVADTARLVAQELTLARSDMGRDLLCAVARTLGADDWSTILPITEDFVVYAVDPEMADLDRNMRASAEGRDRTPR